MMVPKGTRGKMILLLMIMTPGIPEYLTGSSRITDLIVNTPSFFIGLILNIGLYSTGALLIREFSVRFNKGWGSILALGCAYGIMEEGVSVHTFVQTAGNPVGLLSIYGRYFGVNWVWSVGLTVFHAVFSIALPLLLLSLAFPEHSKHSLLGKKGIVAVFSMYMITVVFLNLFLYSETTRAMPTVADYVAFAGLSLIFVLIASKLSGRITKPKGVPIQGVKKFFFMGLAVFPLYAAYAFLPVGSNGSGRISPVLDIVLYLLGNLLLMVLIARKMPSENNGRAKLSLAAGLVTPLLVWAELMEISGRVTFITIVAIIALVLLFRLRKSVGKKSDFTFT